MARKLPLAPKEKQIIRLFLEGKTIRQIATGLGISPNTINSHMSHARERLGLPIINHRTVAEEAKRRNAL